jgi:hypothetical protein
MQSGLQYKVWTSMACKETPGENRRLRSKERKNKRPQERGKAEKQNKTEKKTHGKVYLAQKNGKKRELAHLHHHLSMVIVCGI